MCALGILWEQYLKGRPGEVSAPMQMGCGGSARGGKFPRTTLAGKALGPGRKLNVEEEEQKGTKALVSYLVP